MLVHEHDKTETRAETVMGTWRRKRTTVANMPDACKEVKGSTAEIIAEEAKEQGATTASAINEGAEDMIASVARFTAQLALCTLTAWAGRVERGEMDGTREGVG